MPETLSGGCLCGDVRYEVQGEPVYVFHCHCSMCRRAGGTAFQTWAASETMPSRLRRERRNATNPRRLRPGVSADVVGGQLFYNYTSGQSPSVWVTVGTLDHPESMTPQRHVFEGDRVPWVHMEDGLPRTDGDPEL